MAKRDHVDPVKALQGVANILELQISASNAKAVPADTPQTFNIEGTSGAHQNPQARLLYFQNPEGKLDLAWRVETDTWDNWFLSYVDAATSQNILAVADYTADATYQVL